MGFHREGNRKAAAIGHDIQLVKAFDDPTAEVIEVEDEYFEEPLQYPSGSAALEHYDAQQKSVITSEDNLLLSELTVSDARRHLDSR